MRNRGTRPIRTVLVVPTTLHRDALRMAVEQAQYVTVVGTFGDADRVLQAIAGLAPDVAVLDLELGGSTNGIQLAVRLQRLLPSLGIVLLVSTWQSGLLTSLPTDALQRWSYLFNTSSQNVTALARAIKVTHANLLDLGPARVPQRPPSAERTPSAALTPRQREVLQLLAHGLSNRAIAERLHLKEKTIENQLAAIYGRLQLDPRSHVHRRVLAARHVHEAESARARQFVDADRAE